MNKTPTIKFSKVDEATLFVECDERIGREMSNFFSVYAPNYRWAPLYKQGRWDGKIRFFDYKNHLPIGLIHRAKLFAKQGGYEVVQSYKQPPELDREEFVRFVKSLNITDDKGEPMTPRDYQLEAAYDACSKRHVCMEVPTAGGKTLIMYIITRFFEKIGKRLLCVVPSVSLVEQGYGDFFSYGWEDLSQYVHMIYAGKRKDTFCPIIISTWQSLQPKLKEDPEYFQQFDGLLVDEAHGAKATVLKDLCKSCTNASWRLGLSGTYPEDKSADRFTIEGGLGPVKKFTTYKELQDKGHIAGLKIFTIILKYPLATRKRCYEECGGDYHLESDFINGLPERINFIRNMAKSFDKNGLILFTKIEKHGEPLKEALSTIEGKKLLYIVGSVDVKEREMSRMIAEKRNDVIILGSFGTMSTGINIKNIHFIVFASGYKSRIKILQSIGRGLRKHTEKLDLILYDIIDDMSFSSKADGIRYVNHSVKHFRERTKIYDEQGFSHKWIEYKLQ